MDQKQRNNTRTLLALGGIAFFCAMAIFIALAILFVRVNAETNDALVGVPINVGGQTVIIYPEPAMSVRIVSEPNTSSIESEAATATASAQSGTGGQGQDTAVATQVPDATAAPPQVATLPAPLPTPTPWPPSVILIDYVVVPGDTLYRLTIKNNTSIDLMARYNIAAGNMIVGNTIRLPIANPAFCPNSRPHVVRDQQTVSEIAVSYGTTPQAIAAANGLDANYSVKTSQVICVPY